MDFNFNNLEPYKDNYNIYNLITKIDKNYKLFFDKKHKCFCIINIAKNNQICLNFNDFSLNIINSLQMTRVEHSKKIFNFIDKNNADVFEKNKNKCKNLLCDAADLLMKYSKRTNSISNNDINKIIKDTYA